MGITISADDPRSIRAIELAADAAKWRTCRTPDGEDAFVVPSQSQPDRTYVVTSSACDCSDFIRAAESGAPRACKHVLAVRLYRELVRAQQLGYQTNPRAARRAHLRLVN
ncbi:MAG: hypothetical protein JO057_04070 [Chloroflexi bacterium]|nr:hypothetical protein [Chloroflexota bacterium]